MIRITSEDIETLSITPTQSIEWVKESFLMKPNAQLPAKISIHPQGSDFINTMPCMLPQEYHLFGCKVVSRIKGQKPALKSEMMVFDTNTGELMALINSDWITSMRTGAVAALAINTLQNSNASIYSFIGLGVIGHATLKCLIESNLNRTLNIRLMRYKNHAEETIQKFSQYKNVRFTIVDTVDELIDNADVIVSCITDASGLLVDDVNKFKPGVLIVPVHTRGFQNCDIVFDKVFGDDTAHLCGFEYFNQFKSFAELSDVLSGQAPGRESDEERILSYNIGLGLHDITYAWHILQMLNRTKQHCS